MSRSRILAAALAAAALVTTRPLVAQNPTQGVRLGLSYGVGVKPGVIVLPVDSAGPDSLRAIVQRDLDYGDRVNVIALESSAARALAPRLTGRFNYPLFSKLGAAAIVQAQRTSSGVRVAVYDVTARKLLRSDTFELAEEPNSAAWRMAVHGLSDEVQRWIDGQRGIAQTRMLFVRDGKIWIVDSDGANERRLTSGKLDLSPSWSPTGRSFVYSGYTDRGSQIATYDFASGDTQWKMATSRGLNITPTFTPDGSAIVYASGSERGTELVRMNSTSSDEALPVSVGRGSDNTSPSFSPDGRRMVFMSGRSGQPQLYVMDADGTNPQLLTQYNYGEGSYRASPDWSPDGRAVAYQARLGGAFQIMTIDLRDRSTKQLTSDGENEDPSWAPDARHIVFSSTRSGSKQLWVVDSESGRLRQLTRGGVSSRLPAWSPPLAPQQQLSNRQ